MSLIRHLSSMSLYRKPLTLSFNKNLVPNVNFYYSTFRSSLLKSSNRNSVQKRYFFFKRPTELSLKIKDDIPNEYNLIYRNTMSKYLYGVQVITTFTAGIISLAFIFSDSQTYSMNFERWSNATKTVENEMIVYVSVFIFLWVLMQIMVAKNPLRIYKVPNTSKYIMMSPGEFPFSTKRHTFNRGQLIHLQETGFLPWKHNRYLIKSETAEKRIILLDHYFRRPADLYIMLGEQRDPELEVVKKK